MTSSGSRIGDGSGAAVLSGLAAWLDAGQGCLDGSTGLAGGAGARAGLGAAGRPVTDRD
ncbi:MULTISPECIES: hypothetical protein [Aphanothece]|uniref:hypothetical protein n=1 Tax=Aphanothece TaxID=1121 RepID=UPI00398F4ADE